MTISASQPELTRRVAGRYELLELLGNGSFGRTYLAHDREADRRVAIKLLDPRATADWKGFERFEREASVLRALRHHGIPEVFELVRAEWEGAQAAFLVMEYVEGESLARVITDRTPLDPADVLNLFLEQLAILEYLHSRVPPVLHRDIKPANIIVRPNGLPALVDFGSVRAAFLGADESGSTIAGTYGYMPYEQYMGQATPGSDLYALGATFLHLLTGRPPRDFMSGDGTIEVPDPLPGDPRLRPVLVRLLRRSPAERFQSARDVRQAVLSGSAPAASVAVARIRQGTALEAVLASAAPRDITGKTKKLLDEIAPGALQMMDASAKPTDTAGVLDWAVLAFFSVLTAGILPMTYFAMARSRRRRLRLFLREGMPGTAEIVAIESEKLPFDGETSRVSYEFTADGRTFRDTDQILPAIARRWRAGDTIQIMYIPEYDYDSVIIPIA